MNYAKEYAQFLVDRLDISEKTRVVFDASNGTAGVVISEIKKIAPNNLEIEIINGLPDPLFSAHGPNPLLVGAMNNLKREVKTKKADLGVILDADEDRVFFVDDTGDSIHPDQAAILIAERFKGPVILDVRSGYPIREWLKDKQRKIIDSRVGHYFIKKIMREMDTSFGAEVSGHYYFSDFFYADSGLRASVEFLNAVSSQKKNGTTLHDWKSSLPTTYRISEINYEVKDKESVMRKIEDTFKSEAMESSVLDGVRMELGKEDAAWWFNVRTSNTENLLRLNAEAKKKDILEAGVKKIESYIKN